MGKSTGTCIVCGASPTVKAHLFPRALTLDIRGDAPSVVEGSRFQDGYALKQNGSWDDQLLCHAHEKKCGLGEKYAIELIRSVSDIAVRRYSCGWAVPNPKPDLLAHFVYSTVWKFAMSNYGRANGLSLGGYEKEMRAAIFDSSTLSLQFLVGRHRFRLGEKQVPMAIPPHRQKLQHWRTWLFVIGGLQFHLKTDRRPFPAEWEPYLGNDNDPLILTDGPDKDLRDLPILRPIFERMLRRRHA